MNSSENQKIYKPLELFLEHALYCHWYDINETAKYQAQVAICHRLSFFLFSSKIHTGRQAISS